METSPAQVPSFTVGLDVGNRLIELCLIDANAAVVERDRIPTTSAAVQERFEAMPSARICLEVGVDSAWISRLLTKIGHEVLVANARTIALIHKSNRKTDRSDAEALARLGRLDPQLLRPIQHRSEAVQRDRMLLSARDQLVSVRTALINHVRGAVKTVGERLPMCSAEAFASKVQRLIPKALATALRPLIRQIATITKDIKEYDRGVEALSQSNYPATKLLRQVHGVGPITALCYALTIEDPARFQSSRQVGAYLGLTPRKHASGDSDPQLRITKAGDPMLRRLLVSSAQYMLSRNGTDCDLRRYGQRR